MTACRHHVLEQGFCPKTNGAYTWWPRSVVSGLAQASYTVQRIEAQATSKTKEKTKTKTTIWPNIAVGRLVAKSFFWGGLVGVFVFFSEIFGNFSEMVDF